MERRSPGIAPGMTDIEKLEARLTSWAEVTVRRHRFGSREFRFRSAEIGRVHDGGIVDIPFPRSIRDMLLAERLAEEYRLVPSSSRITFRIRSYPDLKHALWLLRLSYLRYALNASDDPKTLLKQESETLHLSAGLKFLLETLLPKSANQSSDEAIPA